ncbi:unnamed protein product [Cuscuta epithymum]|uniref:Uncharacterized protein n=1 Tax=Cuscuta epithymum TaxID=186058 RepID=A0AAV0CF63_9ASTE|nr:unnamed protein product [Cuscuta epithymum]
MHYYTPLHLTTFTSSSGGLEKRGLSAFINRRSTISIFSRDLPHAPMTSSHHMQTQLPQQQVHIHSPSIPGPVVTVFGLRPSAKDSPIGLPQSGLANEAKSTTWESEGGASEMSEV